jgi:hypothetical protein
MAQEEKDEAKAFVNVFSIYSLEKSNQIHNWKHHSTKCQLCQGINSD